MPLRHAASLVIAAVSVIVSTVALAAQRTFVSTGGSDSNACSLAAPCRQFAKAVTVTDPGGEIVVLDSGGYGVVSVNKNVTILSPAGVYAGLSVFAGNDGITVVAPATKVVLRGLSINGQGGNNGIRVQAGEVHVESSVISNMGQAGVLVEGGSTVRISSTVLRSNADGIRVTPAAGTASVIVRDSESSNNTTTGIAASPSAAGASGQVTIERSSVTKNGAGVVAAPTGSASATVVMMQSVASENTGAGVSASGAAATVWVRESAITRNGTGLQQASSAVLNACGANLLVANTTAQSGAINTSSCLDVASAGGTVTSVGTGNGLMGGPITTTGTINLTSAQLLPTVTCATNQIPKWNGSAWACSVDNTGPANAFVQGGNAFGTTAILGTADGQPLEVHIVNSRALRIEPPSDPISNAANIIGGSPVNSTAPVASGATIAGGENNQAGDSFTTVSGGDTNNASGFRDTVAGGTHNTASGGASSVSGGQSNTASGAFSTVVGGVNNTASGTSSVAMGQAANAGADGCFVFADSVSLNATNCGTNTFVARATGGVTFITSGTSQVTYNGLFVPAGGGAWVVFSDRNYKENLTPVSGRDVLERLVSLPVSTWNWTTQSASIRHMGPTAQDFYAAFGLGETDRGISTVDPDGVAFAAIQGLYAEIKDRDATIADQQRQLASDRHEIARLSERLTRLESLAEVLGSGPRRR